jgi:hypothetical protein
MPQIYSRLSRFGVPESYVRSRVLPDWWDDSIADTPLGAAQARMLLARNLFVDAASLTDPDQPVTPLNAGRVRYKTQRGASAGTVHPTKGLGMRLAEAISEGAPELQLPFPRSAADVRGSVLAAHPECVDLRSLLRYCWGIGVPVAHLPEKPRGGGRIDGLAIHREGLPAIVLTKNSRYSAWLLFVLAHDLAHVVLGHLQGGGVVIDEGVLGPNSDQQEIEANRFAVEVLTGSPDGHYERQGRVTAVEMAAAAARLGRTLQVDPGAVILNIAHHEDLEGRNPWPLANRALSILEPNAGAPAMVKEEMLSHLQWERLPDDAYDFVERITAPRDP